MKLYVMPGACSLASHIALVWAGASYEVGVLSHADAGGPGHDLSATSNLEINVLKPFLREVLVRRLFTLSLSTAWWTLVVRLPKLRPMHYGPPSHTPVAVRWHLTLVRRCCATRRAGDVQNVRPGYGLRAPDPQPTGQPRRETVSGCPAHNRKSEKEAHFSCTGEQGMGRNKECLLTPKTKAIQREPASC